MKQIIILFSLFFLFNNSESQNLYIIGHVVDVESKRGIPGTLIYIQGEDSISYELEADEHGYFRMGAVLNTNYTITSYMKGYNQSIIYNYNAQKHQGTILKLDMCRLDKTNKVPYQKVVCPKGHKGKKIIPIMYGLHESSDSTLAKNGKIMLGGQSENICQPRWFCLKDKIEF